MSAVPACLSLSEAAARLNLCRATLSQRLKDGSGPASVRVGRRVLIREDHLLAWLDRQTVHPADGGAATNAAVSVRANAS